MCSSSVPMRTAMPNEAKSQCGPKQRPMRREPMCSSVNLLRIGHNACADQANEARSPPSATCLPRKVFGVAGACAACPPLSPWVVLAPGVPWT